MGDRVHIGQELESLSRKQPHFEDPLPSNSTSKRYRPKSENTFVTQWVKSGQASRPESPVSIESITSYDPPSATPSDMSFPTSQGLVGDPNYRYNNLRGNHIYLRHPFEELPQDISRLVDHIRKDRCSLDPSSDQIREEMMELYKLVEEGSAESDVEAFFKAHVFPKLKIWDELKCVDRYPMARHAVPDTGIPYKVSIPVPDMLYGYDHVTAFPQQEAQLLTMENEMIANSQGLSYPFLIVEFKADSSIRPGSLWVGTSQCLGTSASCVNIAERLNRRLKQCESKSIQPINSAVFSIVMHGSEARLYVSWKQNELDYYMQKIESFLLEQPQQYVDFRKRVLGIIDWGKDTRLKEIQDALSNLYLERDRRETAEAAKSREQRCLDDSASSSSDQSKIYAMGG